MGRHAETVIRRSFLLVLLSSSMNVAAEGWPEHGHDKGGTRYSTLRQITPENVSSLEIAWTYRNGELDRHPNASTKSSEQSIPVLVAGNLIVCSPFNRIIALDPATGRERWVFDPEINTDVGAKGVFKCRGVATWVDPRAKPDDHCYERLVFGTNDLRLIALDARTGERCGGFGEGGEIRIAPDRPPAFAGELAVHSVPAICNGVVVLGSAIVDDYRQDTPSGRVRAFSARNGESLWEFDPVPRTPSNPASETWLDNSAERNGSANVWAHMAVDEEHDLAYAPTSTPAPDSWGGMRPGNNVYANSLVALRCSTGKVAWHYQILRHAVWDYDLAAQPLLVDLPFQNGTVPAVVQNTKQGLVFVFNRLTGEPLFPIEERPVPPGDIPGEWYAPTQPFPSKPPPLVPQGAAPEDAWGFTPWDKWRCRKLIEQFRYGPIYTPPSTQGTIVSPWPGGGVNWGGAAFVPERNWMIVNTNRMMKVVRLIPRKESAQHLAAWDDFDFDPPHELSGTPFLYQEGMLLSPLGAPCNKPPWGALSAVDLVQGEIVWEVPLGSIRDYLPIPIPWRLGTPNIGGPVVTGSGLVFIGATIDRYFRAFAVADGEELWKARLPASATTTPMTYAIDGRQFVVIVAGGSSELPGPRSDSVVAFSLPGPN